MSTTFKPNLSEGVQCIIVKAYDIYDEDDTTQVKKELTAIGAEVLHCEEWFNFEFALIWLKIDLNLFHKINGMNMSIVDRDFTSPPEPGSKEEESSMPTPDNTTTVRAALRFALAHPDELAKWLYEAVNDTEPRGNYDAPGLLTQAQKLLDPSEHWIVYYP